MQTEFVIELINWLFLLGINVYLYIQCIVDCLSLLDTSICIVDCLFLPNDCVLKRLPVSTMLLCMLSGFAVSIR